MLETVVKTGLRAVLFTLSSAWRLRARPFDIVVKFAPEGLAAVVLGRDPTVPFPDGCYVNEALSMDPFTHRRFFEALNPTMCTSLVHAKGAADGAGYTAEPGLVASVLMSLIGDERCGFEV